MAATRRPVALAAAVATVAALGVSALVLPATAATTATTTDGAAAAPKLELKDGTLEWGLKESFRKYLAAPFSGGRITVQDGATQASGNGVFTFVDGRGTYDKATYATDTAFKGGVHFYAHGGELDITLSDVKLATAGTGGAITVDVTTPKGTSDDVRFAALDLSGVKPGRGADGAMVFEDIPATLTKAGAEAFQGQYKEGEVLDPATLSVKAVVPPSPDPSTEPSTGPSTGPSTEPSTGPSTEPSGGPTSSTAPSPDPSGSSSTEPAAEQGEILDGTLDWGVRESFRAYVTGPIAQGRIETAAGATASAGGYRFPGATGRFDAEKQTLAAKFDGKVRFLGHEEDGEYTLDLSLTNLEVRVDGAKGTLVADVSSKDRKTKDVSVRTGLAVADLKLPKGELAAKKGVLKLSGVPATLTADGAGAFAGMYKKGARLDALTIAVALDKNAELPGTKGGSGASGTAGGGTAATGGGSVGGGSAGGSVGGTVEGPGALAATGSDLPAGALIAASGVVVAAGAGVVVAARRRRTA
ncbi:HtaA domain-containing protein [Streptomyces sp. NPDC006435]|uniref:HtaA domain-containing protein n=1 Tax=Streptomyces sp. NPDC006435 TaxID=3154300 RepID=UPI0033B0B198